MMLWADKVLSLWRAFVASNGMPESSSNMLNWMTYPFDCFVNWTMFLRVEKRISRYQCDIHNQVQILISTNDNPSNMCTKVISTIKFQQCKKLVNVYSCRLPYGEDRRRCFHEEIGLLTRWRIVMCVINPSGLRLNQVNQLEGW